ncbi:MAG: sulfatase family protein [Solirubrobacterales bacterium]
MQGFTRTRAQRAGAILAALTAMLTLALLARADVARAASAKPNVILFVTDDQTFRDMLALPRTQALVGGTGATFEKAYASMPLCCPSRITMLTGQYAHNHRILGNTPPSGGFQLWNDDNSLPIWLQSAGYRTIHIGKMPNGYGDPTYVQPGFGPFPLRGEFYAFAGPGSSYYGFTLDENGVPKQYGPDQYQTDVYADIASDRIGDHFTLFPNDPLYMQVMFFAPHDPNTPAIRHQGYFAFEPVPKDRSYNEKDVRDKPGWVRRTKRMGGGLRAKITARYRGRLETLLAVDEAINRIMNQLVSSGALGNTYVIFTSDNGFMQGQHRLHQGKFVPYEPSVQIPLLIRGPGIPPGGVSKTLVSNVDIVPTILDAANAAPGLPQDGRSLLPYAADPRRDSTRPILLETGPPGAIGEIARASGKRVRISKHVKNLDLDGAAQIARVITAPRYRAIRTSRYLLVKYGDSGRELYDMAEDPLQVDSVYKDPRYRKVRRWLIKKLALLTSCVGEVCNREPRKPPKPLKEKPKKEQSEKERAPAEGR